MSLHINAYLRAVAPLGRDSERVGPFTATCTSSTDNPYLNYAIPDDDARPGPADVDALVDWFEARQRRPRLEYVTTEAPAVESALLDAGFVVEGRLPLMVWDPASPAAPLPDGVDLLLPDSDDQLVGLLAVTAEAFGSPTPPTDDDVHRMRQSLTTGSGAVIAWHRTREKVVGGGSFPPIVAGHTEVAGIGVAASHRRRGIGQALARRLAEEAISRGATVPFLMAAGESEAAIYARAGYVRAGDVLHISIPQ